MAKKYNGKNTVNRARKSDASGFDNKKIAIAVCGSVVLLIVLFFAARVMIGGGDTEADGNVVHVVVTTTTPTAATTAESAADTTATTSVAADTTGTSEVALSTDSGEATDTTNEESTESTEETGESTATESANVTEPVTETAAGSSADSQGFYNDIKITDASYGILILCNKSYKLPDDYEAEDLKDVPSNYYVHDGKEYKMNSEALEAFIKMSDAAYSDNNAIDLRVVSGYRSKSYQDLLYNHYVNSYGKEEADTYSARPRHSEHETGLCCDINLVSNSFKNTPDYAWLLENAADYGFILRYPEGKEHITGYMYESWHWRYVGVDTAKAVVESGLTYDEYFLKYILK